MINCALQRPIKIYLTPYFQKYFHIIFINNIASFHSSLFSVDEAISFKRAYVSIFAFLLIIDIVVTFFQKAIC